MASATALIRPANSADLDAVVAFHVRLWRETYRTMAPEAAYDALDEARRRPSWQATLSQPKPGQQTWIAERQGEIVGLIAFGPASHEVFKDAGEIKHLYVDSKARRTGLGRTLAALAFAELAKAEFDRAALAVVRDNHTAIHFYEAMGGRKIGTYTDPGPMWRSENLVYGWEIRA
ncbi:GNAT family N-acetyltransferase [uncultured Cohaesibacter sp.]|uniref:GNAT family N-acetyltransferase n=1 Tax=uncultured Cohaesibacter sp. TaxID=1002546 RepID=UPI0029C8427F|nr:GNAT family N-acetyltransferase [uncultured Cohaesibacter sp.]